VCIDLEENVKRKIVTKPPEWHHLVFPGANVKDCIIRKKEVKKKLTESSRRNDFESAASFKAKRYGEM